MITIYALVDPHTGDIRYIGKTAHSPEKRLRGHMSEAKRLTGARHYKSSWLRQLAGEGLVPLIEVIEEVEPEGANERERHWIAYHRRCGAPLTNVTDGGDGQSLGYRHCDEARATCGEASRRAWRDPNYRARVIEGLKAHNRSSEHRAKISENKRGSRHPMAQLKEEEVIEIKRKIREGMRTTDIALEHGISQTRVSGIKHGRSWRHVE